MSTKVRIKIPVAGTILAVLTYYFVVMEPKMICPDGRPTTPVLEMERKGDYLMLRVTSVFNVLNAGWKKGYIKKIDVRPNGVKFIDYEIANVEVEDDWVPPKSKRQIKVNTTLKLDWRKPNIRTMPNGDTILPTFRVQLFDNKNNPVLDSTETANYFIVLIAHIRGASLSLQTNKK